MSEIEQLIDKFLANRCTPEEAIRVERYLSENPEVLDRLIPLKDILDTKDQPELETSVTLHLLNVIRQNAYTREKNHLLRQAWFKYAAAASVIGILVFVGWRASFPSKNHHPVEETASRTPAAGSVEQSHLQVVANPTKEDLAVRLDDGSSVTLHSQSTLEYRQPFTDNKRQIQLTGTAFFKIAKDKTRPFIVIAGGFATTVLGTSFTVVAEKNSHTVTVSLFTGKVSVNTTDSTGRKFNAVVLSPGQQLQVDRTSYATVVNEMERSSPLKPMAAERQPGGTLDFKQSHLPQLFATLEKTYNITITFNQEDMARMMFTGRFSDKEDVESILNSIALLNGLTVVKTAAGYEIKK